MSRQPNARQQRNAAALAAVGTRPGYVVSPAIASQPVSRNLLKRTPERKAVTGPVRKTRAQPMSKAMRSGEIGVRRTSLWAASPTLSGDTAMIGNDRKWSSTVSDHG